MTEGKNAADSDELARRSRRPSGHRGDRAADSKAADADLAAKAGTTDDGDGDGRPNVTEVGGYPPLMSRRRRTRVR